MTPPAPATATPVYRNAAFAVEHRPTASTLYVGVHCKPDAAHVDALVQVLIPWLETRPARGEALALHFADLAPPGEVAAFDHEAALGLVGKLHAHREALAASVAGCVIQGHHVDLAGLLAAEAFSALYGHTPPIMLVDNAQSARDAVAAWTAR